MRSVVGAAHTSDVALANESGPVKSEPVWLRFQPSDTWPRVRRNPQGRSAQGPHPSPPACHSLGHDHRYRWGARGVSISSGGFTMGSEKDDDSEPPTQVVFGLKEGDETIAAIAKMGRAPMGSRSGE